MTIVAVNGGGNTPQGVQLERCFVKSWSTSGDADGTNDSFIFADYKPTESLAVDPTNPNVDLRLLETPGPDDNVGLPAVQMGDGLLMPPSNIGGVSVGCGDVDGAADALGDPVTFTFTVSVDPSAYEGSHLLYQDVFVPPSETGSAVAMEALTIAHEGFWLI
jgi:hypothetical protein